MEDYHADGSLQEDQLPQAIVVGGWVYVSGQTAFDPDTGRMVLGEFEAQARQVLENIRLALGTAGCGFSDLVKLTIYLSDVARLETWEDLCTEVTGHQNVATTTIQASGLPFDAHIMVDAVATLEHKRGL